MKQKSLQAPKANESFSQRKSRQNAMATLPVRHEYFQRPPQSDCFSKHTISGISWPFISNCLNWYKADIPLGPAPITQTRFALFISG